MRTTLLLLLLLPACSVAPSRQLASESPKGPQCRARIFWRCEPGFVDICNVKSDAEFHQCVPK